MWFLVVAAVATLASARLFYSSVLAQTGGAWSMPLDDVYIHFDYARATARGHPFEWSEGNGYSSGNTSVTYPFVLAIGYWLGARGDHLVPFAGIVAAVSVLAFLWGAARAFRDLPRPTLLLLLLTTFSTGALGWSLWSGMEVAWFLGLWGIAFLVATEISTSAARPERGAMVLGAIGAMLCLTRPEGATSLAVLGVYAASAVGHRLGAGAAQSVLLRAGVPAVAVLFAQACANRVFTGEWTANGAVVKLALENPYMTPDDKLADWQFNLRYCFDRMAWHHFGEEKPWGKVPFLLALVPLVDRRTRSFAVVLLSSAIAWTLLVALNGQVRWQNERYIMPAVAWLLVSAALGLAVVLAPEGPKTWGARAARFTIIAQGGFWLAEHEKLWPEDFPGAVAAIAALVACAPRGRWARWWGAASAVALLWLTGKFWEGERIQYRDQVWFFGRASRNIRDQHIKVGQILRELDPRVRRVLVGDAGAILYAADVPGFDLIGLGGYKDLPLARAGVHGLPATLELIERLPPQDRPDTMAIFPTWWPALPGWFGQPITSVPVPGNVISGGAEKMILHADWHLLDTGALPRSLASGERVVDEVDVCDLVSERRHGYQFPHPLGGYAEMRVLSDPSDAAMDMWDGGRRIPNAREEKMRVTVSGAQPRLVLRTAVDRDSRLEVRIGDKRHDVPLRKQDGWVEVSVPLDGAMGKTDVTIIPRAGEWVSYHAWVVARLGRARRRRRRSGRGRGRGGRGRGGKGVDASARPRNADTTARRAIDDGGRRRALGIGHLDLHLRADVLLEVGRRVERALLLARERIAVHQGDIEAHAIDDLVTDVELEHEAAHLPLCFGRARELALRRRGHVERPVGDGDLVHPLALRHERTRIRREPHRLVSALRAARGSAATRRLPHEPERLRAHQPDHGRGHEDQQEGQGPGLHDGRALSRPVAPVERRALPGTSGPSRAKLAATMGFSLSVAAATDVGRKRQNNEDCYLSDTALGVFVVADGIGGKRGGEEASKLAADVVRARVRDQHSVFARLATGPTAEGRAEAARAIEEAIQAACAAVHQRNVSEGRRMGTTIDVVVHAGAFVVLGHVGDSRIYLVRQGAVHRLTEDHTIAAMQLKAGALTREEAEASRFRGVLTRSIGSHESVQVDTLTLELASDDALLLCTDGLHMYLRDEALPGLLGASAGDPARTLVDFANAQGGADNVTAILVRARATTFDDSSTIARQRIDAVRHVPLLAHLSYKEQAAVLSVASPRSFASDEMVVREGEQGSDMFIVVSGRVSVERHKIPFAELSAGGHFGEMALVEYAERSASVRALEPTETLVLTQEAMGKLMRADPVVGVKVLWALVQSLSARLRSSNAELVDWRRGEVPHTIRVPFDEHDTIP